MLLSGKWTELVITIKWEKQDSERQTPCFPLKKQGTLGSREWRGRIRPKYTMFKDGNVVTKLFTFYNGCALIENQEKNLISKVIILGGSSGFRVIT